MQHKLRLYIDTSVIGGCFDDEFKEFSVPLLNKIKKGEFTVIISEITQIELKRSPKHVQNVIAEIPKKNIEFVELTEDALILSNEYISSKVLTKKELADAQHIAIATINKADHIVSWNFKHIVNIERIRGFNSINLKLGYSIIDIRSPPEVISYD